VEPKDLLWAWSVKPGNADRIQVIKPFLIQTTAQHQQQQQQQRGSKDKMTAVAYRLPVT